LGANGCAQDSMALIDGFSAGANPLLQDGGPAGGMPDFFN
jgi:hypothetical protein